MKPKTSTKTAAARVELAEVAVQLAALERMGTRALREKYAALFERSTASRNRTWLRKKIAYRVQELAEGRTLGARVLRRLEALADATPIRQHPKPAWASPGKAVPLPKGRASARSRRDPRLPAVGAVLQREHDGKHHEVVVMEEGFTYGDRPFTSLSTIAKTITGQVWNGFVFFGLVGRRQARRAAGGTDE